MEGHKGQAKELASHIRSILEQGGQVMSAIVRRRPQERLEKSSLEACDNYLSNYGLSKWNWG